MIRRQHAHHQHRRGGATIVEAALVISILFLFMFGIFEYGRFLLVSQLMANAARDGARYASVNTDKAANFLTVDDAASGAVNITTYVRGESKGGAGWLQGFAVNAYPCDTSTAGLMNPITPVVTPLAGIVSWNDFNRYSQVSNQLDRRLAVEITGNYVPVLPAVWLPGAGTNGFMISFLGGSNSLPMRFVAVSNTEN